MIPIHVARGADPESNVTFMGECDGILQQVRQDLPQPHRVRNNLIRTVVQPLRFQRDALPTGANVQEPGNIVHH